jgi:tetratricopeptide (TPR) repeat protein
MPSSEDDDDFGGSTRPNNPVVDGDDEANDTNRLSAIEIGEAGIADAEAALEAMTSFRLAEGALQRNDRSAAEEHAKKAVAGDPTQPDYIALLAWIRSLGAATPAVLDDAIRTMSRVLIEDPSNEKALFYRGKLLVQTNRLPEAMNDFNELLSANPHHREAQTEAQQLKSKLPT